MSKFTKKIAIVLSAALLSSGLMIPALPDSFAVLDAAVSVEAAQYSYTYYPRCASSYRSIVDALRSVGVDSSYSNRKNIAAVNNISNYRGTASQNNTMLSLLKQGKLIKSKTALTPPSSSNKGEALFNYAYQFVGKKYAYFSGLGFHYRAWCADFVSYCASQVGVSRAIPKDASVSGLRTKIKNAGGVEHSKAQIQSWYTPKKGDIIIFKSNGASHVGIVNYGSASQKRIYYVDGNNTSNGNGYNARVNYSSCSYYDSKLTCVLTPNY